MKLEKGKAEERKGNMSKIFKNMIPYWKSIVIIIALLFVQAWCDLSLPSYTSDIIDVGIQNYGVEHVVPEALTADEFETAELFMTDEEADLWESIYEKDGDIYRLQVTSRSELNEIDDWFLFSQDLFVLYNDNVDHLKYKGNYKLTVYADGFKATSVRFKVTNGENVPSKDEMGISQYSFDGVSTASTGSGGGSSSGESSSGSSAISANLVFDTDLLVNAELLEEAGLETPFKDGVIGKIVENLKGIF